MVSTVALWQAPAPRFAQSAAYEVALATTFDEVRACQRLRYDVFNAELGEGLESSHQFRLDRDRFDLICDHLLVRELASGQVVGTYRMQTGFRAKGNAGYYSQEFFEFAPYEALRSQMLELGRACILREHRDSVVLMLLWKGVFRYARETGARFLVGCSSLTSQDPQEGMALYAKLRHAHLVRDGLRTVPRPSHALPAARPDGAIPVRTPRLLRTYLELSAKICGPPAIDREFRTIDFLTLLDLAELPVRLRTRLAAD